MSAGIILAPVGGLARAAHARYVLPSVPQSWSGSIGHAFIQDSQRGEWDASRATPYRVKGPASSGSAGVGVIDLPLSSTTSDTNWDASPMEKPRSKMVAATSLLFAEHVINHHSLTPFQRASSASFQPSNHLLSYNEAESVIPRPRAPTGFNEERLTAGDVARAVKSQNIVLFTRVRRPPDASDRRRRNCHDSRNFMKGTFFLPLGPAPCRARICQNISAGLSEARTKLPVTCNPDRTMRNAVVRFHIFQCEEGFMMEVVKHREKVSALEEQMSFQVKFEMQNSKSCRVKNCHDFGYASVVMSRVELSEANITQKKKFTRFYIIMHTRRLEYQCLVISGSGRSLDLYYSKPFIIYERGCYHLTHVMKFLDGRRTSCIATSTQLP
ncbi:uncharacterized protein CLUP02_06732 [Colletotrichum lupini]|uniref:Uncharacterized protein n=1 Tax=Colletotrichum lupini TaxID=145971 RepID=A0A9Q8WFE2_9PEZI|nr:uncharacterized protein CLUP02_06732 [Colletotrichum lupini]UQC81246.1 hypothetical protein CLUP02_06732 [Colletotrichum lupini]